MCRTMTNYSPLYEQLGAPIVLYHGSSNSSSDDVISTSSSEIPLVGTHNPSRSYNLGSYVQQQALTCNLDLMRQQKQKQKQKQKETVLDDDHNGNNNIKKKIPTSFPRDVWYDAVGADDRVMKHAMLGRRGCGNCLQCVTNCVGDEKVLIWAAAGFNKNGVRSTCSSNSNGSYYASVLHCARLVLPSSLSDSYNNVDDGDGDDDDNYNNEAKRRQSHRYSYSDDEHVILDIGCHIQQIVCCSYDFGQTIAILIRTESHGIRLVYCELEITTLNSSKQQNQRPTSALSISLELLSVPKFPQPTRPIDCFVFCSYGMSPMFTILCEEVGVSRRQMIRQLYFDDYLDDQTFGNIKNIGFMRHASWGKFTMYSIERSCHPTCLLASTSLLQSGESHISFLDLRSPREIEQRWNPSIHEYIHRGVIVDRILHHPSKNETIYVSTSSIGVEGLYELDYRMPGKVITTWSLPAAGNPITFPDQRVGDPVTYLAFADQGNFLSSPRPDTVLSIRKSGGVRGLCTYQPPLSSPLFETHPLETGCSPRCPNSSIAQTSFWSIVDGEGTYDHFIRGLSSVRVECSNIFPKNDSDENDAPNCWGYEHIPSHALLTMMLSGNGSIYCHSLLECNPSESRKSFAYEGLPSGSRVLAVPDHQILEIKNNNKYDNFLKFHVNNVYATLERCKVEPALSRDKVKPFEAIDLKHIMREANDDGNEEVALPSPLSQMSENSLDLKPDAIEEKNSETNNIEENTVHGQENEYRIIRVGQNDKEGCFSSEFHTTPKILNKEHSGIIMLPKTFTSTRVPDDDNTFTVPDKNEHEGYLSSAGNIDLSFSLISSLEDSFSDVCSRRETYHLQQTLSQETLSNETSSQRDRSRIPINFVQDTSRV